MTRTGRPAPCILITGMSGTGKSTVIRELADRGHDAHDLDDPAWSEWVDASPGDELTPAEGKDWVWREVRVQALITAPRARPLFISGCAENMPRFLPLIDEVVLLSAPLETLMQRLARRHADGYGHREEERRKVAALVAAVEPLLRQVATHEIDTRQPVAATAEAILRLADIRS